MIELQRRQAKFPRPVPDESDQRSAGALAPSVFVDTDLIDVQIRVDLVEFVFSASHDLTANVADHPAVGLR
jgi:hypothetical protein